MMYRLPQEGSQTSGKCTEQVTKLQVREEVCVWGIPLPCLGMFKKMDFGIVHFDAMFFTQNIDGDK